MARQASATRIYPTGSLMVIGTSASVDAGFYESDIDIRVVTVSVSKITGTVRRSVSTMTNRDRCISCLLPA
jgi:hypothetical protein